MEIEHYIPLCISICYHVRSTVAQNFHEVWGSCTLCKHVKYSWVYSAHMSPTHNGSLQCFECGNAIEICNGIMFDFYLKLPKSRSGSGTRKASIWAVKKWRSSEQCAREYQKPVRCYHWSWAWVLVLASFPGSHALESVHWNYAGVESQVFFLVWPWRNRNWARVFRTESQCFMYCLTNFVFDVQCVWYSPIIARYV